MTWSTRGPSLAHAHVADERTLYDGLEHGELFDRRNDPDEMRNLYGLPEATTLQADMTNRLTHEMISHSDVSPRPTAFA